jgi:mannose-6-phosphate isomerase
MNAQPLNTETRPWGKFEILSDDASHKVKRMTVEPGHRLSYQRHSKRSEHWFVVAGEGVVTIDDQPRPVAPGIAVDIPVRAKHRIECTGPDALVFIEVQHGSYFGEDDIERFDDDYGRSNSATATT